MGAGGLLDACWECRVPGPTPDLMSQNPHCNKISMASVEVHTEVREAGGPDYRSEDLFLLMRPLEGPQAWAFAP